MKTAVNTETWEKDAEGWSIVPEGIEWATASGNHIKIGKNVTISNDAIIENWVVLNDNVSIDSAVSIGCGVTVAEKTRVGANSSIWIRSQLNTLYKISD